MPGDPQIPYRLPDNPPGVDYAAFMRKKMGLPATSQPQLLPIPGQTLTGTPKTNAGFVGLKTDPIGYSSNQLAPNGNVMGDTSASWNSSYGTGPSGKNSGATGASRVFSAANMKKVTDFANSAAPFMSNIVNAFRKPPMPKKGLSNPYVTLSKVNLQEERNAVERNMNAANRATERNVDGNTAEAVKAFNRGTEFSQLSAINDREQQANTGIANQQAMLDANTTAGNNAKTDDYNQALVERRVAQQREQAANLANAGDKLMMIRNEKEKGKVEKDKANVLRTLYDKSGVLKRDNAIGAKWKQAGLPDPFGEDYKWLETHAYGGMMRRVPSRKLQMC